MSTSLNRFYVQSLDQPLPPQDTEDSSAYTTKLTRLHELLHKTDAVVIGIGSGLSTAAGYDFYHGGVWFDHAFGSFRKAHGFSNLFDGMYHVYSKNEEQWAFNAAAIAYLSKLPLGAPYKQLAKLVASKDHFVLTTNVDGQAPRAFGEKNTWTFQGDVRYLQCSQPCCDRLQPSCDLVEQLCASTANDATGTPRISSDDLPRCPACHHLMTPWMRDVPFLEGAFWQEQKARYETFLKRHLIEQDHSVLFLELGVSSMTPAIIKLPFWNMAAQNKNAYYVSINRAETTTPLQLGNRALVITADLARTIADLTQLEHTPA